MSINKRQWYGIYSAGVAQDGTNTFTGIKGLQSIGINTKFNLEYVFEIGQSEVYENIETVPDVEVTMEKVIDGNPLLWHLLTYPSTVGTLIGRSNAKATIGVSIFPDTYESASGTALAQCTMSGMFASSLNYNMVVGGNFTESVTAVGNTKAWATGAFVVPTFNNTDTPPASGGVQRREDFLLGSGNSKLPTIIPGVGGVAGVNYILLDSTNTGYTVAIQSIKLSANLGREQLFELGQRGPFHRFVGFPVEVRTDVEVLAKDQGDYTSCSIASNDTSDETIYLKLRSGTIMDLGNKNRITSSTMGGANAGTNGGNGTASYSFVNHNKLTITDPSDPSGL